MITNLLTIDVEDNFTFEELKDKSDWEKYEGQVVENTLRILLLLKKYSASATFFVVGKVAERHPEIIDYIAKDGHEIASHSYSHRPLSMMNINDVEEDIRKSADILSSLTGSKVLGYRAMGYSIPEDETTFYTILKKYGYVYDSSKKLNGNENINTIQNGAIYQIYPSVIALFDKKMPFSGGTYLRLLPMKLINEGFNFYKKKNQPVMLYLHPWEFNNDQPKRKVGLKQRLLQSSLTFTTEKKMDCLLQRHRFTSVREYLNL